MTNPIPALSRRHVLQGIGASMLPTFAFASDYPTRAIEVIVPASAGGGTDVVARAYSEAVRKYLPQPVVVNNKPGASGVVGMLDVLNARSDGYKICMAITELSILPHLGLAKFTSGDFKPIALLNVDASAITVRADAPWKTIEEFVAAAKAKPNQINVGNSGNGSVWHLAAAALGERTGASFNHIPFQGGAPAALALMGGHVDAVAVSVGEVATFVQAGKLKILAVAAEQRSRGFDKVPTLKERGIDLSVGGWRGLLAPKNTPDDIATALRIATRKAVEEPVFREQLDKLFLTSSYLDAPEFAAWLTVTNDFFKALVVKSGIKV